MTAKITVEYHDDPEYGNDNYTGVFQDDEINGALSRAVMFIRHNGISCGGDLRMLADLIDDMRCGGDVCQGSDADGPLADALFDAVEKFLEAARGEKSE